MKIYNVGIDLKRAFTDVLRGIVQNEDVMFKTVISDDGKPIDYSTCNIIMVAVRLPDYTTEKTLEAINIISANAKKGIVEFKLPKEFTEQEGVHQLQIAFFDKGNMVKTARFNYCVEDGLLLDEPSETEITSVEDLLKKASEALVTSQEISRAENARIEAEELRNTAEEARISNELERNGAEAFRNERELSRGSAEADRKEAEDIRLENEAERIEAEAERYRNEEARIEAEAERKEQIEKLLPADGEPAENSEKLITSGGVYGALKKIKDKEHYIFNAYIEVNHKNNYFVSGFESFENIREAFNNGKMVIADTQIRYMDENGETDVIVQLDLICTSPSEFFGVAIDGKIIYVQGVDSWECYCHETARKEDITKAIGDIEASLENIINKYGLGGEA